jgi:hypothetical protein
VYLHTPIRGVKDPILHRDFKPSNILLDAHLNVKLSDVGLSRAAHELAEGATHVETSNLSGTPGFIDPLYINSRGQVSELTDGYALGVSLLVCLTGRPATSADRAGSLVEEMMDVLDTPSRAGGRVDNAAGWPEGVATEVAALAAGLVHTSRAARVPVPRVSQTLERLCEAASQRAGFQIYPDPLEDGGIGALDAIARLLGPGTSGEAAAAAEARECVVCMSEPRSVRFSPCGHAACCESCTQALMRSNDRCPTCRVRIQGIRDRGEQIAYEESYISPIR